MANRPPQTRYAQSSGAKIAFQVSGTGPPDLVMVHGLVSHLDLQWQQTAYRRFVRALEQGGRLIRLDKRGTGAPRKLACGSPDWRFAFVPARSAVIEDTWHAMGLCGTGSHHLTLSGVQVPPEQIAAPFFEPARHDGPLWKIPLVTLAAMFLAAVPLGIARRALDEFTAVAVRKVRGPAAQSIGHDADAQCQLARAEAALASARSFLFDTIASVWATACQGDEPSLHQRALILLAANQTVRAATEAVDRLFRLAGAEAVFTHHPLQRCFRDIHTAGQHILFSSSRDQAFAKVRLGIDQPTYLI
jgi:alkylation response protein AidB-like acyl-CoA dehydrogenase